MIFKKFIENIEKIYADQGNKPKGERLRYGQIIMNELWQVWPQKYHQITGSDKDCFYCDVLDKKPYDLFDELQKEWHKPSPEQVRIQRLEKKIKKLQASNKRNKEDIKYYKRILRDFPWVESQAQTIQENIELKKTLKEKNWALRYLEETMNATQILNDYDMDALINLAYNNPAVEKVLRVIKYLRNSKK